MTDSPAATSPSRWRLYGARRTAPEGDEVFAAIGTDPRHTMAYGYAPDAVEELDAVEDPDGRYWGWLRNTNRDRSQPPVYADFPAMVHEHERLFRVCFPYCIEAEQERNAGRLVRLTIDTATATENSSPQH